MRSFKRRSRRGGGRAVKDLVWLPLINNVTVSEVGQSMDLLTQTDWESQFAGLGLERATLLRVVGQFTWQQTAVGTDASAPALLWTMQLIDDAVTAIPDITTRAGMGQLETLWMWARPLSGATIANTPADQFVNVDITAKRKLTTQRVLIVTGRITTDAASPTVVLRFYGRALIDRK